MAGAAGPAVLFSQAAEKSIGSSFCSRQELASSRNADSKTVSSCLYSRREFPSPWSVDSSKTQRCVSSCRQGLSSSWSVDSRSRGLSSSCALWKVDPVLRGDERKRERSKSGKGGPRAEIYVEEAETKRERMSIPNTQMAWIYQEYGPKENLLIAEVWVPDIAPDQVLVRVRAAALNPVDYKRRSGNFQAADSDLPTVPGYDVAGVVVQVGSEVTKFKLGDRVYGDVSMHALKGPKQYGSLGQYTAVEESLIAAIPQKLNFAQAASLPLAVETAYQGLEHGKLKEGQTVLILGGSGGVGSLAIQLAKLVFKASVVAATASAGKVDFVKSLGADVVIDYTNEDAYVAAQSEKYDVVFDTVGTGEALKFYKEGGSAVAITGPGTAPIFKFVLVSKGEILEKLNPFLEDGSLKPIIDPKGPFPFSQVVQAFGYLETGKAVGKVVIAPID